MNFSFRLKRVWSRRTNILTALTDVRQLLFVLLLLRVIHEELKTFKFVYLIGINGKWVEIQEIIYR